MNKFEEKIEKAISALIETDRKEIINGYKPILMDVCREYYEKQLILCGVGCSNNDKYKKAFDLAMKYLGTTVVSMEQSKESEENWVKLKDFIKKENLM